MLGFDSDTPRPCPSCKRFVPEQGAANCAHMTADVLANQQTQFVVTDRVWALITDAACSHFGFRNLTPRSRAR
jgi:hypothetical protein